MNTLKRAALFISRKRSRSIVLLLILTIVSSLVLTCISISRASGLAMQELRSSMGGYFKIETASANNKANTVEDSVVDAVMQTGGIGSFNGMDILYLQTPDLKLVPGRFTEEGDEKAQLARFLGNTDSGRNEYFVLRSFTLTEGRHIEASDRNKALISQSLADLNGIGVGDMFTVTADPDTLQTAAVPYTQIEVVGIYSVDTEQYTNTGGQQPAECDIADNFIFTDTQFIRAHISRLTGKTTTGYSQGVTFFVEDPRNIDGIVAGLSDNTEFDMDDYQIVKNNAVYEKSAAPLERMTGLMNVLLLIIVTISIVLVALILTMWIRDRLREIGIYMSIGIRKIKIVGQLILENLMLAAIAFVLAWGLSSFLARNIGNIFLDEIIRDTSIEEAASTGVRLYYDPVEAKELDTKTLVEIEIGAAEVLSIIGIGSAIVVIATGLSSISVIRMKPKEILSSIS